MRAPTYIQWLIVLFLTTVLAFGAGAQAVDTSLTNQEQIDEQLFTAVPDSLIINLSEYLPPLPLLIDSAIANSPDVAYFEARVKMSEYSLASVKKDWASNISVSGTFNGGNNNLINNQINVVGVNYGGRVTVPLSIFIGRQDRVGQAEAVVESETANLKQAIREVRIEVIETYNRLFQLQRKLEITNEARQQAMLIMEMGNKRFIEGELTMDELGQNTELKAKYANLYEDQRTAFSNTYFSLQRIVGVPFSKFKTAY